MPRAAVAQSIAADAAGQADAARISVSHPAIAAGEDDERHQIARDVGSVEMGLEAEEIRIAALPMPREFSTRVLGDATVLRVGHAYEKATSWRKRRPELAALSQS